MLQDQGFYFQLNTARIHGTKGPKTEKVAAKGLGLLSKVHFLEAFVNMLISLANPDYDYKKLKQSF